MRWRERLIRRLGGVAPTPTRSMSVEAIVERAEDLRIGWHDPGADDITPDDTWTPPRAALADPERPISHL